MPLLPGCPEGWTPGFGKCYNLYSAARDLKLAASVCALHNSILLTEVSKEENHFLSNLVSKLAPDIHQWYTGGKLKRSGWYWYSFVDKMNDGKRRRRVNRRLRHRQVTLRSRFKTVRSPVTEDMWFPGWPSHGHVVLEPESNKRKSCLTLSNLFTDPYGGLRQTDYFFWKADYCRKRHGIAFVCQMDGKDKLKRVIDCYEGDGNSYRGETAVTHKGVTCLSWAESSAINGTTHPGKGLGDHNYCRNPDGEPRPWCWINHKWRKMGFCNIPSCSDSLDPAPPTSPSPPDPNPMECPGNQFYCSRQRRCISRSFRCDNEADCVFGEDEQDCEYALSKFSFSKDKVLALTKRYDDNASGTYFGSSEQCAKRCLASTRFVCRSFTYTEKTSTCRLSSYNTLHGSLEASDGETFYELISQLNCSGMFQCNNKFCIDSSKTCDGHDDCNDLSDELICGDAIENSEVSVSLVGGGEHSGTVEISYMGSTGVICDDYWDIKDATVVCRMLGYRGAEKFTALNSYNYPPRQAEFLLDDVECLGNESSISECPKSKWKRDNCRPYEIAGVQCQMSKVCEVSQFKCADELCVEATSVCNGKRDCADGSDERHCDRPVVALVNGTHPWEGRVEITLAGLQGSVCDDRWDDKDAAVVCRSLGYDFGGKAIGEGAFGQASGQIWMDNVACTGLESSLAKCPQRGWGLHDCDHDEDAAVSCFTSPQATTATSTTPSTTTSTKTTTKATTRTTTTTITTTTKQTSMIGEGRATIQLVGGELDNSGNVAVIRQGSSFRVCDDEWGNAEANVVCRSLGYRLGGIPTRESYFGNENNSIILDNLQCKGTEKSLLNCIGLLGVSTHNCDNSELAGVICYKNIEPAEYPEPSIDTGMCGYRPYDSLRRRRRSTVLDGSKQLTKFKLKDEQGLKAHPVRHKIAGGNIAPHGKFPWQAGVRCIDSVRPDGSLQERHICGATIVSEYWVLSAAHCFRNKRKSELRIIVGDHNNRQPDRGEQIFEVEEVVMHENYTGAIVFSGDANLDFDIAVLKLKAKNGHGIVYNKYVQPACLPTVDTPSHEGTECFISGWGRTIGTEGPYPDLLKAAMVPLISRPKCQYLYKQHVYTKRMMCAGYIMGGVDTCEGDSGGPLVCKIRGVYTVMGITSWGRGCAAPDAPGVYSRVQEYLPWILDSIEGSNYLHFEKTMPPRPRAG